jgi:tetratricopeptide (TPR) repeat protein
MKLPFVRNLFAACLVVFLAANLLAAEPGTTNLVTRDEMANNYLQFQEQLHASQMAIEQKQQAALDLSQSNAMLLAQRLQSLEQTVASQKAGDAEAARKTQQFTMIVASAIGLTGLVIMVMMVYFQWRAFTQLAQISARQHVAVANGEAVHQLAAPGRATVEASATQLLSVVSRLEQRINELESGQRLLPEIGGARPVDMLVEGQRYLDANLPLKALECFDQYLASQPDRPDAVVKRAAALEKLGRDDEALAGYNRAIAMDSTLVIAHLHKGGLLNRLRRYDEALNCYEKALVGQDKRVRI